MNYFVTVLLRITYPPHKSYMEGVDFTMALPEVLGNFQHYSRSYYVVFASVTVFTDFLVVFLLTAKKISLDGLKLNHVMLLNLALCDIVYEILTTSHVLAVEFLRIC